jgi:hypothetical protein
MEFIPEWMYVGVTVVLTVALGSVGYMQREYVLSGRSLAWTFLLLGWAAITLRFWIGIFGDRSISYAGAVGLLLLAVGTVLEAMRK